MKLSDKQKNILLKEIAYIIVHKKEELILVMNKSGISNVTVKTESKVLSDRTMDGIRKNQVFRKNFAGLITDINLKKAMLGTDAGDVVDTKYAVDLGGKILGALNGLAELMNVGKKPFEEIKAELNQYVAEEQETVADKDKSDEKTSRVRTLRTASISMITLGTFAVIGIGVYAIKKFL